MDTIMEQLWLMSLFSGIVHPKLAKQKLRKKPVFFSKYNRARRVDVVDDPSIYKDDLDVQHALLLAMFNLFYVPNILECPFPLLIFFSSGSMCTSRKSPWAVTAFGVTSLGHESRQK